MKDLKDWPETALKIFARDFFNLQKTVAQDRFVENSYDTNLLKIDTNGRIIAVCPNCNKEHLEHKLIVDNNE